MERLTERDDFGNADIIGVDSEELQINLEFEELNCVTDALNKLAAYEDTGFEPKDIPTGLELASVFAGLQRLKQYESVGTVDRFRELMEAEQDGRLTILPPAAKEGGP